ncbi:conserved protein of unknown function [Methylocella tundrae]|uniref:Uncharacterized protein n=1 Tax=Methylocella tundrae TaxID=227605 RepID=A0A4V6IMU9_METTU|nr:conserved protein of unknown function [Methylocella tundrae]
MLDDINDPMFAKSFPGDDVDAALPQKRPQGGLDGAGVGARHDADAIIGRNLQDLASEIDCKLQLGFANGGAVRTARWGVLKVFKLPARTLGRRTARKIRPRRFHGGSRRYHFCHPYRWAPLVGEGCPVYRDRVYLLRRQAAGLTQASSTSTKYRLPRHFLCKSP